MVVAARSSSRRRALDQATINKIRQGLIQSMHGGEWPHSNCGMDNCMAVQ
jgi:hypothetical protein